jgi:2-C-methyl-D-erythritol 4-phosphate cytidylyltransferase/2-C-methyl-D-erythritol 2,4-cyclodiphosphate synthase
LENYLAECVALIVASGRGQRFGGERPKQWQPLAGRPLLRHCLERFCGHPRVGAVRAVIHPEDRDLYDQTARELDLLAPAEGGPTRQESVRLGLESLAGAPPEVVLIHDGVRPLVDAGLIDRVLDGLAQHSAVLPGLPVTDTLKRVTAGRVLGTVERSGLWRAQTPQGFAYEAILAAHRAAAGAGLTDDVAVAEAAGLVIATVAGDEANLKITERADLARAERLLAPRLHTRTGLGFDVHRLGQGDGLMLMGIRLSGPFRLIGHSDADVGLHAVTDALLGALGAGDIGTHFPPADPRWAGADSALFLEHARGLIEAAGGRIEHVDATLVCERPRIGPHRAAMVARLAGLLGLDPGRVSVKATTTEGLGFTGRREGIAAQAIATVSLPV